MAAYLGTKERHMNRSRPRQTRWLCITMLACAPLAGADDLDTYRQRIDRVAHELVANIRPTLDAHAQRILDDISFETPLSWETNADAHKTFSNHRVVEYNAGFLAVTDWLSL